MDTSTVKRIQKAYFELLDEHYKQERSSINKFNGDVDRWISETNWKPSNILLATTISPISYRSCKIMALIEDIKQFWSKNQKELFDALSDSEGLRICLWGDIGIDSMLPSLALYFDLILVPDSFLYATDIHDEEYPEDYELYCFKWISIIDKLKTVIYETSDYPFIVIYPQQYAAKNNKSKAVTGFIEDATLLSINVFEKIFKVDLMLKSMEELVECIASQDITYINSVFEKNDLLSLISNVPIEEMSLTKSKVIDIGLKKRIVVRNLSEKDILVIFGICQSIFFMINAREKNCDLLNADNLVGEMLQQGVVIRNEYYSESMKDIAGLNEEEVVAYSFKNGFRWLKNLSIEDCLLIRNSRVFEELRIFFNIERKKLKHASVKDFEKLSKDLEKDIVDRILEHERELSSSMNDIKRITRNSIISLTASASFGLASMAFPSLSLLTLSGFAYSTIIGGKSILNLIDDHLNRKRKLESVGSRPISFLYEAYRKDL